MTLNMILMRYVEIPCHC